MYKAKKKKTEFQIKQMIRYMETQQQPHFLFYTRNSNTTVSLYSTKALFLKI